jgi:dinuclear metal center YbgI/SA1388 family protein
MSSQADASLADIVAFLDQYLAIGQVTDAPNALNGLQVENGGRVTRIAAAVDACAATIEMAASARADLLLVHHGLFWGGLTPLVGPPYQRVSGLIRAGIALYSAHLPLDRHPDVGNAAVLARALEIEIRGEFGAYRGQTVGVWGELDMHRDDLAARVERVLGATPRVLPFGPARVRRVGIVTGAGGSEIGQAAAARLDTYLTGEGPHWSYFDAEELGLNVLYAGHYATETVGVKALAEQLSERFNLPWSFLDHPTGL